ncbi:hypothetical protein [Microbacterium sp. AG790]|uniref:hypothetical protein n=1 Tax=Microbacterium sp. AG790 TaxID=2183995 RepID=UPI000EB25576|nr:hypothetical protein [Microbacterium sp. AG790]
MITLREVYDLVLEVRGDVATLKTTELKADVDDHESRIRSLEKWVWRAVVPPLARPVGRS